MLAMVKALHRGFDNCPKIRRIADPVALTLDLLTFEPKNNRLRQRVEDYYCAKFQGIPI